jgi:PAS domain S-box-containing protein
MEREIKISASDNYIKNECYDLTDWGILSDGKSYNDKKTWANSYIVGIGTSGEGLVALEQFFANMPSNRGISFIIVYHSSFDYKSILIEILSKYTAMKIIVAQNGMKIEPDCIYISPYKSIVTVSKGVLMVNRQNHNDKWERTIDSFFCSLAVEQGDKSVGIVFPSKGTDGINGSIAIREAGGCVFAHIISNGVSGSEIENSAAASVFNYILSPETIPYYLFNHMEQSCNSNKRDGKQDSRIIPDSAGGEDDFFPEAGTENLVFKLANEYLPPCVVIDRSGTLLYVSGDCGKYLRVPCGKVNLNIFKMVPENISYYIKNAVNRVGARESTVAYSNVSFEAGEKVSIIDLKIKQFSPNKNEQYIVIFFIDNDKEYSQPKCTDYCENDIERVQDKQCLGSIYLDMNLCVRRFSPAVKYEINLVETDIGRAINHISHNFKNENLAQNAIRVLNNSISRENEVQSINGKWYLIRYSPYVEFDNSFKGVVISLIDITGLKNTNEKFSVLSNCSAYDQSSSMVMITNVDGKVEYVNPKFTEVTGYSREEIVGRDFGILKSGVQDAQFYKEQRETITSGKEWKGELCNKKKNGEIYWEMTSISPVRNNDGVITHFLEIKEDITAHRLEVEELRRSEEKLRQVYNSLKDLVFLYSVNVKGVPGKLLEVNNVACDILGYSKEELKSMNIYDYISDENIPDVHKINQNLLTLGHSTFESNFVCKNGYCLPVKVSCNIFTSCGEKVVLMIAQDITEQMKTEEALLKSKERYEYLVEYSPYSILIVSNGTILFSNNAGLAMFDVKNKCELVGSPIRKFFNIDIQKVMNEQNICSDVDGNAVNPFEEKIIRPDGSVISVEVTAMPFFFDGKTATLLMIRDITSRKQAEELQRDIERSKKLLYETIEYDTLKTEFFSNISHELRTPLNGLLSTQQLLCKLLKESAISDKSGKISKYVDIMKQNSFRLLRLVNNMIDITRIDTGFLELNLRNCNIVNIVEETTMAVADFLGNKRVSVIFDTDVEEKIIACDPEKIERIMLNLLSNAVKFSKSGGRIEVNLYNKDEKVLISVKDNGIGIPEDKLGVIFERFRQVDKSLTRNHEGSGIGLSLAKSLVEMHGGTIFVKSEIGKGAEFVVELPTAVLLKEEPRCSAGNSGKKDNFEKVSIEFSDIYDLK